MKLLWPNLYGSAASGACSAPSRAKKAPSAWLRRSSATNSFAEKRSKEFQEGEVPRFPVHSRPVCCGGKIRRPNLQCSRGAAGIKVLELLSARVAGSILDEFLARSLRRRAGYAGVPWPLSEATPALFFSRFFSKFKNSAARRKTPPPLISNFYFLISIFRAGLSL